MRQQSCVAGKAVEGLNRLEKVKKTLKTVEDLKKNLPKIILKKKKSSSKKTVHKARIKRSKIGITHKYKK